MAVVVDVWYARFCFFCEGNVPYVRRSETFACSLFLQHVDRTSALKKMSRVGDLVGQPYTCSER